MNGGVLIFIALQIVHLQNICHEKDFCEVKIRRPGLAGTFLLLCAKYDEKIFYMIMTRQLKNKFISWNNSGLKLLKIFYYDFKNRRNISEDIIKCYNCRRQYLLEFNIKINEF